MNEELPYRERLALIRQGLAEKTTGAKPKKYLNKVSKKKQAEIDAQKVVGKPASKLELDVWFDNISKKHSLPVQGGSHCMECGYYIPAMFMRHATAHLLPKKLFKSIATHELNYLILGAGCGCHEKTHRVDKFVTMKVWPEAARRIKIMMPLLPFDELKYLSSQLLTALDNTP